MVQKGKKNIGLNMQNFDNPIDFSVYDTFDKVERLIIRK